MSEKEKSTKSRLDGARLKRAALSKPRVTIKYDIEIIDSVPVL